MVEDGEESTMFSINRWWIAAGRQRFGGMTGITLCDVLPQPPTPGAGVMRRAVLFVLMVLVWVAPARAQEARVLVSNTGQSNAIEVNFAHTQDHAQLFHTGDNAPGYTLTKVEIFNKDDEMDPFDVEVCEAEDNVNAFPSGTCTALTPPADFTDETLLVFTASPAMSLSADTDYSVVLKKRTAGTGNSIHVSVRGTTSTAEDSASDTNWGIDDRFYWKSGGTTWTRVGTNRAIGIRVTGTIVEAPDDATLKALTISSGTLTPAFMYTTESYTVTAVAGTTTLTVTASPNNPFSTVALLDGSNNPVSNPIPLAIGSNTIKIRVTANDGTTTKTYTLTVTRLASTDAALSGLELTDGTDALTFGTFASGTTRYTVTQTGVVRLTLKPTPNVSTATVSYTAQLESGPAQPVRDADPAADEFQVDLAYGKNHITIEVTAEDQITTQSYTVSITRAPQTLVSNLVQTARDTLYIGLSTVEGVPDQLAQEFRTGSHTAGYAVTAVTLDLLGYEPDREVRAFAVHASASNTDGLTTIPGSKLTDLAGPPWTHGRMKFLPAQSVLHLEPDTSYFVVLAMKSGDVSTYSTENAGQTSTFGWTIADRYVWRSDDGTSWESFPADSAGSPSILTLGIEGITGRYTPPSWVSGNQRIVPPPPPPPPPGPGGGGGSTTGGGGGLYGRRTHGLPGKPRPRLLPERHRDYLGLGV